MSVANSFFERLYSIICSFYGIITAPSQHLFGIIAAPAIMLERRIKEYGTNIIPLFRHQLPPNVLTRVERVGFYLSGLPPFQAAPSERTEADTS